LIGNIFKKLFKKNSKMKKHENRKEITENMKIDYATGDKHDKILTW